MDKKTRDFLGRLIEGCERENAQRPGLDDYRMGCNDGRIDLARTLLAALEAKPLAEEDMFLCPQLSNRNLEIALNTFRHCEDCEPVRVAIYGVDDA